MAERRIYLDNAATSFPKPEAVYAEMELYHRQLGTAVGRGATRLGGQVQRVIDRCRLRAARLFGVNHPRQVIFTFNGTDALNLAIHGLLRDGDRVITSVWEHNSVLRPLRTLQDRQNVTVDCIRDDGAGSVDLGQYEKSLKRSARLVVITHASNVTGVVQPVQEMARLAHAAGALVLVDAAQTAGHLDVSFENLGADLIACPGHKGLLGPLGTGLLAIAPGVERHLEPIRQGGTGTVSESDRQPESLPERYESGNHNAPGLFGLEAALAWREERNGEPGTATRDEQDRLRQWISSLCELPGIRVHCAAEELPRVGVVSISFERLAPQIAAALLDEHFSIETRAGLHCAPLAHTALGTLTGGGTVRFSPGPFTTDEDLDNALEALSQIAAAM